MTGRDRVVMMAVVVVLVLVMGWFIVVSPKRQQAASLNGQVVTATGQLATANSQAQSARSAEAKYEAAYASIVSLGKAVPPSQEVSSLIYQISQASHQKNVEFSSLVSGSGSSSSSSSSSSGAAASAAASGFMPMPFTFIFSGTFSALHDLLQQLDRSTVVTASGRLVISGRLLTIQSIKLGAGASPTTGSKASGKAGSEKLSGTITATAYVLPAAQGLTAGATPGAPAAGSGQTPVTAASSAASSTSPTAPALARVTP